MHIPGKHEITDTVEDDVIWSALHMSCFCFMKQGGKVLDKQPRSAAAVADEHLVVLVLHRDDFMRFIRERPVVGLSMMRNLVERVRYTTTYLQEVVDATNALVRGEYEEMQEMPASSAEEEEIQKLIQAFIEMVQHVQTREQTLQRVLDEQAT